MHEIRRRHLGFIPINQGNSGRRIYVAATNYPLVAAWFTENSRTQQEINEEIRGLSALAQAGDPLNASGTIRCKRADTHAELEYYLDDGDVILKRVIFSGEGHQPSGRYTAKYDGLDKIFQIARVSKVNTMDTERSPDMSSAWEVSSLEKLPGNRAHFAAFGGRHDSGDEAAKLLAGHLFGAYGDKLKQINPADVIASRQPYTLLHLNPGVHHTAAGEKLMEDTLLKAEANALPVHIVVQGRACQTLAQLAQKRGKLVSERIQIYLSNPEGVSRQAAEAACNTIGARFRGVNTNPFYLQGQVRNAAAELSGMSARMKGVLQAATLAGSVSAGVQQAQKLARDVADPTKSPLGDAIANEFGKIAHLADPNTSIGQSILNAAEGVGMVAGAVLTAQSAMRKSGLLRKMGAASFGNANRMWYAKA